MKAHWHKLFPKRKVQPREPHPQHSTRFRKPYRRVHTPWQQYLERARQQQAQQMEGSDG